MKPLSKLFLLAIFIFPLGLAAQQTLSLKAALEYAAQHNPTLKNSLTDMDIARKKVRETTATGLPQVSASVSYNNYLDIPTQLIPDFLSPVVYGVLTEEGLVEQSPQGVDDRFFEAQFGTRHNLTASATVSQLVFNGPYIVGLQAARAFVDFSRVQHERSSHQVREAVSNAYYQALVADRSVSLLDSTRASLADMLEETRIIFSQGFIEETDVDQLELLLSDLDASLANARNQRFLAYRLLKYQMGMPLEEEVVLSESLNELLGRIDRQVLLQKSFDPEKHIDLALIRNQEVLNRLDLKRYQSLYLPSLSAFYSYQQVAQRQDFDFLDAGGDWFPTQVLGLQLDIPLFSSGGRTARVQQARLELQKTNVLAGQLREGLTLEAANARSNLENAWLVFRNKEKSMETAEKIYRRSRVRYQEGLASSLDLQQTYNQYLRSESDYLLSLLQLLQSKAAFERTYTAQ